MFTFKDFMDIIREKLPHIDVSTLSEDSKIADSGLESMDIIEIVVVLEDHLKIPLSDVNVKGLGAVSDILRVCNDLIQAKAD